MIFHSTLSKSHSAIAKQWVCLLCSTS